MPLARILDSFLALSLRTSNNSPLVEGDDPFAQPASYRAWLWPLRRVLALRYLSHKQTLLSQYHLTGTLPSRPALFTVQLTALIGPPVARTPWLLRPFVLAGLVTLLVGSLLAATQVQRQRQRQRDQLLAGLLSYSGLVHEQTTSRQHERILRLAQIFSRLSEDPKTEQEITLSLWLMKSERSMNKVLALAQRNHVVGLFPDQPQLQTRLSDALDAIGEADIDAEAVAHKFGQLNQSLSQSHLPYYVSPTILGGPCASFLSIQLRAMLKAEVVNLIWPGEQSLCKTTLVLPYLVVSRMEYGFKTQTYPVYHLQQMGPTGPIENALGLTYSKGEGSQLHIDRIRRYAIENILPALTPRGRSVMFPWLRSNWQVTDDAAQGIEQSLRSLYSKRQLDELRRYAEKLVRYEHVLEQARMHQTLLTLGHRSQPRGDDDLRSLGLDVLSNYQDPTPKPNPAKPEAQKGDLLVREANELRRGVPSSVDMLVEPLARAVAHHEVQHQLHDRQAQPRRWLEDPRWLALGHRVTASGAGEEVAAYLVELYYGPKVRHIVLTQLASFALSVLPGAEREYEAGHIVLAAMLDAHHRLSAGPRRFLGPLDLLAAFQTLSRLSDQQLAELAQKAYLNLMGMELPELTVVTP